MSSPHYPEEFKVQAVNQVAEKKLLVAGVAACLAYQHASKETLKKTS